MSFHNIIIVLRSIARLAVSSSVREDCLCLPRDEVELCLPRQWECSLLLPCRSAREKTAACVREKERKQSQSFLLLSGEDLATSTSLDSL